jgi:hypothetical protein
MAAMLGAKKAEYSAVLKVVGTVVCWVALSAVATVARKAEQWVVPKVENSVDR